MEAVSPEFIEDVRKPVLRRVGGLPASAWLDLWEGGGGQTSAQRGLAWLRAARLEEEDDPAGWTVAERDAQLLLLRESAFGCDMEGLAWCPHCGERLEIQFTTREILPLAGMASGPITVERGGCVVRFRLPVAGDLAGLSATTPEAARNELLAACFVDGRCGGIALAFRDLSDAILLAAEDEMAREDPHAYTDVALRCPACGHQWKQPFDAAAFLWSELEGWACRTLNEVHVLASAYGWTESEILSLSPTRRQLYLSLLGR